MGNLNQEITPRKLRAINIIAVDTGRFIAIRVSSILVNGYNKYIKHIFKTGQELYFNYNEPL